MQVCDIHVFEFTEVLTVIEHDDIKNVQKLTFVFMDTFKLAIKHGRGVHINTISIFNIASQFIFVVLCRKETSLGVWFKEEVEERWEEVRVEIGGVRGKGGGRGGRWVGGEVGDG